MMPVRQEAPMTAALKALRDKRASITTRLAQIDDLRPGFLTARFRKCGKPNCHCAQKDSLGHGPSYSLTHRVGGKTVTQVIPQGPSIERAKSQIAEYRRFRNLVRELIAVSEQICRLWKSRFDNRFCNWPARLCSNASTLTFPMKAVPGWLFLRERSALCRASHQAGRQCTRSVTTR